MYLSRCLSTAVKRSLAVSLAPTTCRLVRSNLHQLCNTSSVHTRSLLGSSSYFPHSVSVGSTNRLCSCGLHQLTEGDEDLVAFLNEEIEYEKNVCEKLPTIVGFKAELKETTATFSKTLNGEKVVVSFDINDNVNMDDDMEDSKTDDVEVDAKIISYPSFKVQIVKEKGTTLQFYCEYNHPELDDEGPNGEVDDEDNFEEPFRIDNVMIMDSAKADDDLVYQAETDTMDPNLYNLLMNMLYERGVTNEFARSIVDYSTKAEHHFYLDFLGRLHTFTCGK